MDPHVHNVASASYQDILWWHKLAEARRLLRFVARHGSTPPELRELTMNFLAKLDAQTAQTS